MEKNGKKPFYKNYKTKKDKKPPKYDPFKKKLPTWKSINSEIEELTAKYEQVNIFIFH
jgi:hypothetical protein